MKLWVLRPVAGLEKDNDPWEPWYKKAFGFVVRAETEEEARSMADADGGAENYSGIGTSKEYEIVGPWLDSRYSTCEELTTEGEAEVVMRDFWNA